MTASMPTRGRVSAELRFGSNRGGAHWYNRTASKLSISDRSGSTRLRESGRDLPRLTEYRNSTKGANLVHAELQGIRTLVADATLPVKVQQSVLSRFDQLPTLYDDLNRTYESRFADRIIGSIEGMVRILAAKDACPDSPQLATTMVNRIRAMHDQYGIAVALKPPLAAKAKPKKKSAKAVT
jgi:hypothetical protein